MVIVLLVALAIPPVASAANTSPDLAQPLDVSRPAYGGGNQAFGFNLYGPSGLTFAGQVTGTNGNSATAQYTLANGAAMSVLAQIYNYTNGGPVSYTFTVSGLSGGSAAIIQGVGNATPNQSIPVSTINASLGGSIVGSSAGSFNYYTLRYPGGRAVTDVADVADLRPEC